MAYTGIIKGTMIEITEPLPYPDGQPVSVAVEPLGGQRALGSPELIRQTIHQPPHLRWEDVDVLEHMIDEGKLVVPHEGVFDEGK